MIYCHRIYALKTPGKDISSPPFSRSFTRMFLFLNVKSTGQLFFTAVFSHGSRVTDQDQPVCAEDRADSAWIPHQVLDLGGGQYSLHYRDNRPAHDCLPYHLHGVGSFLHSHIPSKAVHMFCF